MATKKKTGTVAKAVKAVKSAVKKATTKKKPAKKVETPVVAPATETKPPEVEEELKCIWDMGTPHNGEVKKVEFFSKQIKVPVCESHIEEHKYIMILHKNNYDIEEVLNQTPEWRKQEVLVLKLSGLDTGDVEL